MSHDVEVFIKTIGDGILKDLNHKFAFTQRSKKRRAIKIRMMAPSTFPRIDFLQELNCDFAIVLMCEQGIEKVHIFPTVRYVKRLMLKHMFADDKHIGSAGNSGGASGYRPLHVLNHVNRADNCKGTSRIAVERISLAEADVYDSKYTVADCHTVQNSLKRYYPHVDGFFTMVLYYNEFREQIREALDGGLEAYNMKLNKQTNIVHTNRIACESCQFPSYGLAFVGRICTEEDAIYCCLHCHNLFKEQGRENVAWKVFPTVEWDLVPTQPYEVTERLERVLDRLQVNLHGHEKMTDILWIKDLLMKTTAPSCLPHFLEIKRQSQETFCVELDRCFTDLASVNTSGNERQGGNERKGEKLGFIVKGDYQLYNIMPKSFERDSAGRPKVIHSWLYNVLDRMRAPIKQNAGRLIVSPDYRFQGVIVDIMTKSSVMMRLEEKEPISKLPDNPMGKSRLHVDPTLGRAVTFGFSSGRKKTQQAESDILAEWLMIHPLAMPHAMQLWLSLPQDEHPFQSNFQQLREFRDQIVNILVDEGFTETLVYYFHQKHGEEINIPYGFGHAVSNRGKCAKFALDAIEEDSLHLVLLSYVHIWRNFPSGYLASQFNIPVLEIATTAFLLCTAAGGRYQRCSYSQGKYIQ